MNRTHGFYKTALSIAHELYAGKTRSGGNRAYIEHPLALVDILSKAGHQDDELLSGAVLHDAIEENEHSNEVCSRLRSACSASLFELISEVTDVPGLSRDDRRNEQLARAKSYSRKAALIRLADKLANMKDILDHPPRWAPKHILSYCSFAMAVVEICREADQAIAKQCDEAFDVIKSRYAPKRSNQPLQDQSPS